MEEYIQELLNSIPQGVTYTTFPEDLEPEDISQERIEGKLQNNFSGHCCIINLLKKRFQKKQARKLNNKFALM